MSATEIIFYAIAVLTLLSALGVTMAGNIVYAALLFIATLGGVAAMYLLLTVEFLPWCNCSSTAARSSS